MRQLFPSLASVLALGLVTTSLVACSGNAQSTPSPADSVHVTGTATVEAVPDEFVIHATAVADGKDLKAISKTVNDQTNQVLALADKLGIDKKHLQALNLTLSPQWEYQPKRELVGYQARRDLTITLTDMKDYGALMEGMIDIGITNIGNTQARVSNQKALTEGALADAVSDARNKAQKLAKAANRKLGAAITIQETGGNSATPVMMRAMAAPSASDSARYEPGQVSLQQRVSVTFKLVD